MADIFHAAAKGNLARVQELLAQGGLDLTAFQPVGEKLTALCLAANRGHLGVAKALICKGAPLNVPDEDFSPLHGAVFDSHHDVAALLLREGAAVDACAKDFGTPLCCAKDRRMAALLIAAGANVNGSHFPSPSPLQVAAFYGHLDVIEEILSHPDINVNKQEETYKRTPLHSAAFRRHPECVAALLAAGADASLADKDGLTPLLLSFTCGVDDPDFRIIAMLVAAGDRQWAHIPSPCPGLESALHTVWTVAPEELGQLAARLHPEVKRRIRAALCTMHRSSPRHLPEAIRMRLLDEAFNV